MGVLRLYLAICVIAAHSEPIFPWKVHDGREAVQIFFMISGFYMALISNKYKHKIEFYCSRLLRIFVPYFFVLTFIVVSSIVTGIMFDTWGELQPYVEYSYSKNGFLGVVFVALSNLVIACQDMVMFLTHDAGHSLQFTTNFSHSQQPLYKYLIIPQGWSISLELFFYLLAPFLVKMSTYKLVFIAGVSTVIRIITYELFGLTNDPWTYRFFPFELALFILGIISYRLYSKRKDFFDRKLSFCSLDNAGKYSLFVVFSVLIFFVANSVEYLLSKYVGPNYSVLFTYCGWVVAIPILFSICKDNKTDRLIGELSYSVYLVHVFIVFLVTEFIQFSRIISIGLRGEISAIISILLAIALIKFVTTPLEKKRYQYSQALAQQLSKLGARH